jgi:biopolymer transport protein ExbD
MGARLGGNIGDDLTETHEINVTPFIDVMLVLLIIFMVAAPLATVDIGVELPASTATPPPRPDKPVFITVKPDLSVAVGENIIPRTGLRRARCHQRQENRSGFPARRQDGALRRTDGRHEPAAQRGLSQGRAGRARRTQLTQRILRQ